MDTNVLYYGDNLEILRDHIPDNSIDLVYLDPPFNSKATYNVLFKEPGGKSSEAQISAFEDTWQWGLESEKALREMAESAITPQPTKELMSVLPNFVGQRTAMRAYLTMMAVRLVELKRVLNDTGSLYLHCDPTASHYLKMLLDTIFGPRQFVNEITWVRSLPHNDPNRFGRSRDSLFFYAKTENALFNPQYRPQKEESIKAHYRPNEQGRMIQTASLLAPGGRGPRYEFKGYERNWRFTPEKMAELERQGRVWHEMGKLPRRILYLDESKGALVQDHWDDITPINSQAKERLGYPTQKPLALLERIIKASSNEGDVVLDPFCGCGTAVVAAQKLKRKWIGIDVTYLAIGLMEWRLRNMTPQPVFKVIGAPEDLGSAVDLASRDKYQFQWWAVTRLGGQPYGDRKKGADTGIDGYIYYMDEKDKIKKAIVSVKAGRNVNVSMIRDLGHVIEREKADIGVFVTLEKPTRPMIEEAALKGFYNSPNGRAYPRLQILTIEEILNGKSAETPSWIAPIAPPPAPKKAPGKTARLI